MADQVTPELLRALFPLGARHRAIARARAALQWVALPFVFAAALAVVLTMPDEDDNDLEGH